MLYHSGDPGSTDIPKAVYLARQSKSRSIKEGQERGTIDNVGPQYGFNVGVMRNSVR